MDERLKYQCIQAGLTNLEVKVNEWEWKEKLEKLTAEHIAFCKNTNIYS